MNHIYSYSGLEAILKSRGLTKSDLRQRCGFSTSTLAKFSAGQSVSMELLADIAVELGCELGDIVRIRPDHSPGPWAGLGRTRTFCVRILCLARDGSTDYVYGYAVPFSMTEGGITQWKVDPAAGQPGVMVLTGYADAPLLREFIASVEQGQTLGQFADRAGVTIENGKGKDGLADLVRSVVPCGGQTVYRPPFLLPSWEACRRMMQEMLPELSPTGETMVCESLIGLGKRALYTTDGDVPDTAKMERLLDILHSELPVCRSASDVRRLGNFEVLTYPSETYDGKAGVTIRVEKAGSAAQRILLSFGESAPRGDFLVGLATYMGTDPISDTVRPIHCDGSPLEIEYHTQQLVSRVEVKLWENSAASPRRGELAAHWAHDLIMGCAIGIDVVEQQFSLADHWSKMLSRTGRELKPSRVSRLNIPPDRLVAANPWDAAEDALVRDFAPLLPDSERPETDCFFPAGEENQAKFFEWLKDTLRKHPAKRVVLIDPFVKAETVTILMRCLEDVAPAWELYMDRGRQNGAKRVKEIQEIQKELDVMAPPEFSIWSVDDKLHDRYLILLGADAITVYLLSNSFDTVAEQHSSAVVQVGDRLAWTIFNHYLSLFAEARDRSELREVYVSSNNRKQRGAGTGVPRSDITVQPLDGIDPEGNVGTVDEAKSVISRFLREGALDMMQYFRYKCLNFRTFLSQSRPLDFDLMIDAEYLTEQEIVNDFHFTWRLPILGRAVKTLLRSDLRAFLEAMEQAAAAPAGGSLDLRPGFLGIVMLYELIEGGEDIFQDDGKREIFFRSKLPSLRAITAIRCIYAAQRHPGWPGISVTAAADRLQKELKPEEALCALVFFIRELRIFPRPFADEKGVAVDPAVLYSYIARSVRNCLKLGGRTDSIQAVLSPLYPKYSHDVGCLLQELRKAGVVQKDTASEMFCAFILKRYRDSYPLEQDYLSAADLDQTRELLDMACEIDPGVVKQVQKGLKKMEMNLCSRLYQPFLKAQNYDAWKHSIDLFGCLVYLELCIAREHNGICNKIAVDEYRKICENFQTDLRRYSDIYGVVEPMLTSQL